MSHPGDGEKRGAYRGREKGGTTVSRERFPCYLAAASSLHTPLKMRSQTGEIEHRFR